MIRRSFAVGVALVFALSFLVGCAGASSGGSGSTATAEDLGCTLTVRETETTIHPETSRLSCAEVRDLLPSLPSRPGHFLMVRGTPRLLWHCQYFGVRAGPVVLRCNHHHSRHFSVRRKDARAPS